MNLFGIIAQSLAGKSPQWLTGQALSIVGLIIIVLSFQFKKNKHFFLMQGVGSSIFVMSFILLGSIGGALFNLCNLVRGFLFLKDARKPWKLAVVEATYVICFIVSVILDHSLWQIVLVALPCIALIIMSVFMWKGNPKHIRWCQITCSSPGWIVHNIFNLSIGGLVCECFNIVSSIIYLVRQRIQEKTTA